MDAIFPGLEVVEAHPFRVTRDAEVAIQELEAEDLLETIEEGVRRRRFGSVVRVTVTPSLPDFVRDILVENLKLEPEDIIVLDPPIGASNLIELYKLDRPDLKDAPFRPAPLPQLDDEEQVDLFAAIRERDILLHRPFDSFEPFVNLLKQAASDPDVLAIKMTLYRVGRDSPIVEALLEAAQNGKEVAALVELKARFDEESNIGWAQTPRAGRRARRLRRARPQDALQDRAHCPPRRQPRSAATCTWAPATTTSSRRLQYTDLDLLTADDVMGEDATELFNFLTGYALRESYESFLVAPNTIRAGLEALIRREIEHAQGRPRRPHGAQGQLARRLRAGAADLRSVGGGREDRSAHPRHVRGAPWRPRRQREPHGYAASSADSSSTAASTTSRTRVTRPFLSAART